MGGSTSATTTELIHLHFEVRTSRNVNSDYGVGQELWWPKSEVEMSGNFVELTNYGVSDQINYYP